VSAQAPAGADPNLKVNLTNRGGGLGRVVVAVNGVEVHGDARGEGLDANARSASLKVDLTSPQLVPGQDNTIEVKVYNKDGSISSRGVVVHWTPAGRAAPEKPHLFAVVMGVSKYDNPQLNLNFSAKDARDMAGALQLGGQRLLGADHTHVTLLSSSPQEWPAPAGVAYLSPTRAHLEQVFDDIGKTAHHEDILLVYCAGHGLTVGGVEGQYC